VFLIKKSSPAEGISGRVPGTTGILIDPVSQTITVPTIVRAADAVRAVRADRRRRGPSVFRRLSRVTATGSEKKSRGRSKYRLKRTVRSTVTPRIVETESFAGSRKPAASPIIIPRI
jgi:hypothetical protein